MATCAARGGATPRFAKLDDWTHPPPSSCLHRSFDAPSGLRACSARRRGERAAAESRARPFRAESGPAGALSGRAVGRRDGEGYKRRNGREKSRELYSTLKSAAAQTWPEVPVQDRPALNRSESIMI